MGAWGAGSFENDAALDFASEISTPEDLLKPLQIKTPEEPIDGDLACEIIVVGECVAAMRGHPSDDMPDSLFEKVQAFGKPSKSLYHHTRDHLAAVMGRGELMELWAEDDPSDWNAAMHDLVERLNLKAGKAGRRKKKLAFNQSPCMFCDKPMGETEFSMFNIDVDLGAGAPVGMGGFAHLECLNSSLHPKYMIRRWIMHDEDMPTDLEMMLEEKPSLDDPD